MPAILATIGATLGKIGVSLLMSLLTEDLCKKLIIHAAETISKWSQTDVDDKIVKDIKAAWKIED